MNERRANPHGCCQTTQSVLVDALTMIVATALSVSFGLTVGRLIYRTFLA